MLTVILNKLIHGLGVDGSEVLLRDRIDRDC